MIEYVILIVDLSIKLLLFGTHQSTDFEVHRNWKAITNSLPIREWYVNKDSKWTLDYPPIFAYMEYFLGAISKLFDRNITILDNFNYQSWPCIAFQRSTVLIGDILLFYSIKYLSRAINIGLKKTNYLITAMLFFSGLIMLDNMHFQYNTLLFSVFFFSIGAIVDNKFLLGAFFFTVALCMKHIYIYMAPGYLIFYLRYYIFTQKDFVSKFKNFIKVGIVVASTVIGAFSPFIFFCIKEKSFASLVEIFERLFPFQRGLLHSYWAPNFWALYSFLDKVMYSLKGKSLDGNKKNISALGVTQVTGFDYLNDITPKTTNIIIVAFLLIFFTKSLFSKVTDDKKVTQIKILLKYCIVTNLIFFNFGYQVHEKAFVIISLMTIIYVFMPDQESEQILRRFGFIIIIIGALIQIPLIHDYRDYLPKISIFVFYVLYALLYTNQKNKILLCIYFSYIIICLLLDFNCTFAQVFEKENLFPGIYIFDIIKNFNEKLPFASLMMFSVINAFVVQILFVVLLLLMNY